MQPSGASTLGVSYKYTILDTSGGRSAAQVPQLPQTSYQALNTPYAFFGLGRTNNYIENLFAGATRGRVAALEMVIPNSKLVVNPGAEPDEWHKELYLRPGQWIPWVGVTVLGTMVALSGVVLVLHLNEKVRLPRGPLWVVSRVAHSLLPFSCSWDLAGGRAGAAARIASYQL
jgi:integrin alpha FG-GAP repeat containing protein 1